MNIRHALPQMVAKLTLTVTLAAIALILSDSSVEATDNLFQYKFPCVPVDDCYVTTLAHVGNAFDFDPKGSAGLGVIPVVSEGTFRGYITQNAACTWPDGSGLGKYAVIDDMHGRTMRYAHLSEFGGLPVNGRVVQGDKVGTEGNTGYSANCAPHLHLEGIATAPGIDGIALSSITAGPTLYTSSNSVVGAFNLPGAAIRQKYLDLGNPFTSWASVGWTADWTGSQAGCDSVAFCRLYVHYVPDPAPPDAGHWGSTQTFRLHPGTAITDDGAIMAGRWTFSATDPAADPYWVNKGFFAAWTFSAIGIPIASQIGTSAPYCQASIGCVAYQRFNLGYIWQHTTQGVRPAVFCPDYTGDDVVRIDDILLAVQNYLRVDNANPWEPWAESRYDVNGDGVITIAEINAAVANYTQTCYP